MAYLVDRKTLVWTEQIVAIVSGRSRGRRSRVILTDGSLYQTLTRPKTLVGALERLAGCPLVQVGARRRRGRGAGPAAGRDERRPPTAPE